MANQDDASKAMADALEPVYSTPGIEIEPPKPAEKWVYAPQVDEAEEYVITKSLWGKSDTIRDAVLAPKIKPFVEAVISPITRRGKQRPLKLEEPCMTGRKSSPYEVVLLCMPVAIAILGMIIVGIKIFFFDAKR